jgi:hypothetical protein
MRTDPFAILAIAPSVDINAIKRAYFSALQRCPPHLDPEGFQRIRGAYEQLTKPGGAASAFLSMPAGQATDAVLSPLREKWTALIHTAREALTAERERRSTLDGFVAQHSTRSWSEITKVAKTSRA